MGAESVQRGGGCAGAAVPRTARATVRARRAGRRRRLAVRAAARAAGQRRRAGGGRRACCRRRRRRWSSASVSGSAWTAHQTIHSSAGDRHLQDDHEVHERPVHDGPSLPGCRTRDHAFSEAGVGPRALSVAGAPRVGYVHVAMTQPAGLRASRAAGRRAPSHRGTAPAGSTPGATSRRSSTPLPASSPSARGRPCSRSPRPPGAPRHGAPPLRLARRPARRAAEPHLRGDARGAGALARRDAGPAGDALEHATVAVLEVGDHYRLYRYTSARVPEMQRNRAALPSASSGCSSVGSRRGSMRTDLPAGRPADRLRRPADLRAGRHGRGGDGRRPGRRVRAPRPRALLARGPGGRLASAAWVPSAPPPAPSTPPSSAGRSSTST